jgi:hypothetical protein
MRNAWLGTEAAFFDSGAYLIPHLGGRVSQIARKPLFIHETPPSKAVPHRHHFPVDVVPNKRKKRKQLSRKNATKWSQPFMFHYRCLSPMIRLDCIHAAPIPVKKCEIVRIAVKPRETV